MFQPSTTSGGYPHHVIWECLFPHVWHALQIFEKANHGRRVLWRTSEKGYWTKGRPVTWLPCQVIIKSSDAIVQFLFCALPHWNLQQWPLTHGTEIESAGLLKAVSDTQIYFRFTAVMVHRILVLLDPPNKVLQDKGPLHWGEGGETCVGLRGEAQKWLGVPSHLGTMCHWLTWRIRNSSSTQ